MKPMKQLAYALLAVCLLLTGCVGQTGSSNPPLNAQETVDNIFSAPPASSAAETQAPTSTANATEPAFTTPSPGLGTLRFGPENEHKLDELGSYFEYDGGQMHLPFHVRATGLLATYEFGILLFVDGRPQPYRLGPDGDYAYMHIFSLPEGAIADVYFTPVTGQEGDALEFYALCVVNPNYVPSQGLVPFGTDGLFSGFRLKYNATPPEADYPEKTVRLKDLTTTVKDCSAVDILGWSDDDLIGRQASAFKINGKKSKVYNVTEDSQITLRYEVWGTPYVHYGLVFIVDNEPVYAADCADIFVTVEMGKKTVIEATLDITGFDGESVVYAVLVPRNYRTSEIETNAGLDASPEIYLLARENPYA